MTQSKLEKKLSNSKYSIGVFIKVKLELICDFVKIEWEIMCDFLFCICKLHYPTSIVVQEKKKHMQNMRLLKFKQQILIPLVNCVC